MLFATNTAITAYAFFTASKVGKTGISVFVSVNGPSGNLVTVASATAATAVDATNQPGLYSYTLAAGSTASEGAYSFHFYTSDGTVDQQHLQSLMYCYNWIGNVGLIKVRTDQIGSGTTTFTPLVSANNLTISPIIIGNDYKAADGRSLDFTVAGFPSFSGGSATFTAKAVNGTVVLSAIAATILSATQLRVELTRAQTLSFSPGSYACSFTVTLSNGDTITPVFTTMTVINSGS